MDSGMSLWLECLEKMSRDEEHSTSVKPHVLSHTSEDMIHLSVAQADPEVESLNIEVIAVCTITVWEHDDNSAYFHIYTYRPSFIKRT